MALGVDFVLSDGSHTILSAPNPTVTAPPVPSGFPGKPASGHVRWAAIAGNGDPVARHETAAGRPMGLRRTFHDLTGSQVTKMITIAKDDLAKGRVPFVSVKLTPYTWQQVADRNPQAIGALDDAIRRLGALTGPVWFAVHHEPENDDFTSGAAKGGAPVWRQMQVVARERIVATGVKNVAFGAILMSYTFHSESGRNPADWWVDGIWDFMGIDHYQSSEGSSAPQNHRYWTATVNFLTAKKKIPIAIGEWGNRGTDATAAAEMQSFYDYALASGASTKSQVVGMAYFDSGLNSPSGSWELVGEPLTKFRALMKAPTSVLATQS